MLPSSMATTPYNSRCMAGMTTNCCSPCLRAKQGFCRKPFGVCVSRRLEKSPQSESCGCWKRTAERVNSLPADGIPSGKSYRCGQDVNPAEGAAVQIATTPGPGQGDP